MRLSKWTDDSCRGEGLSDEGGNIRDDVKQVDRCLLSLGRSCQMKGKNTLDGVKQVGGRLFSLDGPPCKHKTRYWVSLRSGRMIARWMCYVVFSCLVIVRRLLA